MSDLLDASILRTLKHLQGEAGPAEFFAADDVAMLLDLPRWEVAAHSTRLAVDGNLEADPRGGNTPHYRLAPKGERYLRRKDLPRADSESVDGRPGLVRPPLLCVAGFDGSIKLVNPALERCSGYATAELVRRPFLDLVHPQDRTGTRSEIDKLTHDRCSVRFSHRGLAKDGTCRWITWWAFPSPEEERFYAVGCEGTGARCPSLGARL